MAVSKRLRFEVLRRDNHTCYYCGRKPPEVELTIDHVLPQALGGTDEATNLVTCCKECNSGKTSIAPGSPLLAQVDEDAARWSAAMQAAIVKAEADHEAVIRYRDQFLEAWNDHRQPADLDENWRVSVETFRTRGLPIEILIDAVHRAMAKDAIRRDVKFRYMCGIAWAKITEIEKHARAEFKAMSVENDDSDDVSLTFLERLQGLDPEAYERHLERERSWADDYDLEEGDDRERVIVEEATVSFVYSFLASRARLARVLDELLHILPEMDVAVAYNSARAEVRNKAKDGVLEFHKVAARTAELLIEARSSKFMAAATVEQQEEWLLHATTVWGRFGGGWSGTPDREKELHRAGVLALQVTAGWRWETSCTRHGSATDYCPRPATAKIAVSGCTECGLDPIEPAANGMLLCEQHLEEAVSEGYTDPGGHHIEVTDYIVFDPKTPDEVPF